MEKEEKEKAFYNCGIIGFKKIVNQVAFMFVNVREIHVNEISVVFYYFLYNSEMNGLEEFRVYVQSKQN